MLYHDVMQISALLEPSSKVYNYEEFNHSRTAYVL
jgi:hypothetical protein